MKKLPLFLILILFVTIFSCKDDETEDTAPTPTPTPTAEMKCKINGVAVNLTNPAVSVTVGHTFGGGDTVHSVMINFLQSITIGTFYVYPWSGGPPAHPYGYYNFTSIDSGMVLVTDTAGHKIKGTFYFKSGSIIGTEGTFENVPLP